MLKAGPSSVLRVTRVIGIHMADRLTHPLAQLLIHSVTAQLSYRHSSVIEYIVESFPVYCSGIKWSVCGLCLLGVVGDRSL